MIQVPSDTAGAVSPRLVLTRRGESGFALLWLFLLVSPFLCPLHLFSVCLFPQQKEKNCSAGSVLLCKALQERLTALVGCVCPGQACNCRPSPALLITTVISIIAVCYPRAQAPPGCSDLSSPSFLSRTLSPSPVLVCSECQTCCWARSYCSRSKPSSSFTRCHFHHFSSSLLLSVALRFLAGRAHNSPAFIPARQKPLRGC